MYAFCDTNEAEWIVPPVISREIQSHGKQHNQEKKIESGSARIAFASDKSRLVSYKFRSAHITGISIRLQRAAFSIG